MTTRTEQAETDGKHYNVLVWDYADWNQYNIADENWDLILVLDTTGIFFPDIQWTEL